jgi:type VI secretion system secreted protein VgrG
MTKATVFEYDWTRSHLLPQASAEEKEPSGFQSEIFFHPQGTEVHEYKEGKDCYTTDSVKDQAKLILERARVDQEVYIGNGNVLAFTGTGRFNLDIAPEKQFLITEVEHHGSFPEAIHQRRSWKNSQGRAQDGYRNSFKCIPSTVPYRPPEVENPPKIRGIHLATVVGPDSDNVETDIHGRVRIRFHWDRDSKLSFSERMCWARVLQPWAGAGFGTVFIPRIGMEVIVQFVDGDIDRPIVMGAAYNNYNSPPILLPKKKTQSTIKTRSVPAKKDLNGYNQLTFEDASGNEEIYIHAQKNMREEVLHDHSVTVRNDETLNINGNQTQTIGKDQTETVTGQQTLTVNKNRTVTIKGSQSVNISGEGAAEGVSGSKLNITGDYKIDASKTIEEQAPNHIKLTCGGSSIEIKPGQITIKAGDGAEITLDANALMKSANEASKVELMGNDALLKGNATAKVDGPTATLAGGDGNVEAGPTGLKASGNMVDVAGTTLANICASQVKIN